MDSGGLQTDPRFFAGRGEWRAEQLGGGANVAAGNWKKKKEAEGKKEKKKKRKRAYIMQSILDLRELPDRVLSALYLLLLRRVPTAQRGKKKRKENKKRAC